MSVPLFELKALQIIRGSQRILSVPELQIQPGEILAVVGPNGAGKSTLLLALSQLVKPESGQIFFRGEEITPATRASFRRRIALVLQDALLLDTSVFENVALGLRFRGLPAREINSRVDTWLTRLGIANLRKRQARNLSGGEAQRVSLARALALQTDLLLLDEPFSALDAPTRATLLQDFQAVLTASHQTAVFVTHDLNEALLLGSRMAVLINGELRQVGSPEQVLSEPADTDVAAFVGVETILPGLVQEECDGLTLVNAGPWKLEVLGDHAAPGRNVLVCLRPEDITLWREGHVPQSSARNRLSGRVTRLVPQGALVRVVVDCGFPVVALITHASVLEMSLTAGSPVTVTFKASAAHLLAR